MNTEKLLAEIERRYSFSLPAAYRHAASEGWILTSPYERYTPLFMGEWLAPEAILEFDFENVDPDTPVNPGLVPFAQSPGGDPYCWYPARVIAGEAVVGSCEFGEYDQIRLDAPSLLGFVYRQALDQLSAGCEYEDEATARHNLARWRDTWFRLFPPAWQQTFAAVPDVAAVQWSRTLPSGRVEQGRSFLHPEECARIVARDLSFEGIDQTVKL